MCPSRLSKSWGQVAFLRTVLACLLSLVFCSALVSQTLSDAEADRIVASEMAEIEARKAERTPEYTVVSERTHLDGDKEVILRKVLPPVFPDVTSKGEELSIDEKAFLADVERRLSMERRTLSMTIRIFDDSLSEITWRGNGREIVAWSNMDFRYLNAFGEMEVDKVVYSLVAFVTVTSREEELARQKMVIERGFDYGLRELPDPAAFSGKDPEYLVFPDGEGDIPGELFENLDALHRYYVDNEVELKAAWQRAKALAEARKRHEQAYPENEGPVIINSWRIEGGGQ